MCQSGRNDLAVFAPRKILHVTVFCWLDLTFEAGGKAEQEAVIRILRTYSAEADADSRKTMCRRQAGGAAEPAGREHAPLHQPRGVQCDAFVLRRPRRCFSDFKDWKQGIHEETTRGT